MKIRQTRFCSAVAVLAVVYIVFGRVAFGQESEPTAAAERGAEGIAVVPIMPSGSDGMVRGHRKISDTEGCFKGRLDDCDHFGTAVSAIGDLDRDGVGDLAVGAEWDCDGGNRHGAVWVLFLSADGMARRCRKVSDTEGGFTGVLNASDRFGSAVSGLGDLNGDGIADVAVGADGDDDGGSECGAVWILFLDADGTVKQHQKISAREGGFKGVLPSHSRFGCAVGRLGDLNADGVEDLVVGAKHDDGDGNMRGAVWILFLKPDGTVKGHRKITDTVDGFVDTLHDYDEFGSSVAGVGDLNGDDVPDIAVGAVGDNDGGVDRGAVWLLYLRTDGTSREYRKISGTTAGFGGTLSNSDYFGSSICTLGDVDGNGVQDLVVGAKYDDDGGNLRGAVWTLFMECDGSVARHQKISDVSGGFAGVLDDSDQFGTSVTSLGDLDGDRITDMAVGAKCDGDGGMQRGAVWVLFPAPKGWSVTVDTPSNEVEVAVGTSVVERVATEPEESTGGVETAEALEPIVVTGAVVEVGGAVSGSGVSNATPVVADTDGAGIDDGGRGGIPLDKPETRVSPHDETESSELSQALKYLCTDDSGGCGYDVWANERFIYLANGGGGLVSYSSDADGKLSRIDSHDPGVGCAHGVCAYGGFVYLACGSDGMHSYSAGANGALVHRDSDDPGGYAYGVWADSNFVYLANGNGGLQSYTVDGVGRLTPKDSCRPQGQARDVWGDGDFVYIAEYDAGLQTYAVDDGGHLTRLGGDIPPDGVARDVWGDGEFVYLACDTGGLWSYAVDRSGKPTRIDSHCPGHNACGVWGDGAFVYLVNESGGLHRYRVNADGKLTHLDSHNPGDRANGVWGSKGVICVAGNTGGLHSYTLSKGISEVRARLMDIVKVPLVDPAEDKQDSGIVAWGKVLATGSLQVGAGVKSVTNDSAGKYTIVLAEEAVPASALIPIATAETDAQPTSAAAVRMISIDQTGVNTFRVYINDGKFAGVNNEFFFMVVGR